MIGVRSIDQTNDKEDDEEDDDVTQAMRLVNNSNKVSEYLTI